MVDKLFCREDGKSVEHGGVLQRVTAGTANPNGMFRRLTITAFLGDTEQ